MTTRRPQRRHREATNTPCPVTRRTTRGQCAGSDHGPGRSGGTLVAAIGAEPDQLDPHVTSSYNSFQVLENVLDTLVEPDENLEMVPALAESWEVSEDGLTYTFDLRDGVTWHDGSPLTADDVVYSYGRWATNNGWRFAPETEVTAPDADTVVFTLPAPAPNLLSNLGAYKGLAIVQEANVESGDIATAPIGTGPFKMAAWNSGDSIEIVRNDDYWGGDVALDGVTFRFVPDPTVAVTNVQSGEAHWTSNLPPQQVSNLMDSDDIVVQAVPSNDYWYFALNQAREPFDDARVRQALAYAIDREAIAQATNFGNATVNQTAIPATSGWYFEYAPYSRDLDKAKALLEEAGVSDLQVDLMVSSDHPQSVTAAQVIAANAADIGVTVNIRQLDFSTWLADQARRQLRRLPPELDRQPRSERLLLRPAPQHGRLQRPGLQQPRRRRAARPGCRRDRPRGPQGAVRPGCADHRRRRQLHLPLQPADRPGHEPRRGGLHRPR